MSRTYTFLCLCSGILLFLSPPLSAHPAAVHHDLRVHLFPDEKKLEGEDRITLAGREGRPLTFSLSRRVSVNRVEVNGKAAEYSFRNGILSLAESARRGPITVLVQYEAVFDDPAPVAPLNTDHPGYGVNGTIAEEGCFLQEGAGWYPEAWPSGEGPGATYALSVGAPSGMIAVSAGRSLGIESRGGRTFSRWEVTRPVEGLSLSAARYVVREKEVGGVRAATYFFPEDDHLSGAYLEATAGYLTLYENLFGPYPFEKFAVVENFFQTGFGFPSYTLLGSAVLRLPFIVHTSLGHEIAHCWWGNGVRVDYGGGNWSEGLTTYVSDYLYKERASAEEALAYRRQLLRNYATLVGPEEDFPLSAFRTREGPVSKAIGYDKGAMVFHMLRRLIGEEAFWGGLRDVFRERLFQATSWSDFRKAFEGRAKRPLQRFFCQWVDRAGAPEVSLEDVLAREKPRVVQGKIVQKGLPYELRVMLLLRTKDSISTKELHLSGTEFPFSMPCASPPIKLFVDPDYDLFRRLSPAEIPPTVNSLKGSPSVILVLPEGSGKAAREEAEIFTLSLGLNRVRVLGEKELTEREARSNDLLFVGLPHRKGLLPETPQALAVKENGFILNGESFEGPSHSFFGVFRSPEGRTIALFLPLSETYAKTVARKITHYGRYSYLAFEKGEKADAGIWPVSRSPLIYSWDEPQWGR